MTLHKKNLYFIFISLIITICSILYGYFFKNIIIQPPLPSEYLAYKSLNDTIKSANYEIIGLREPFNNLGALHFSPLSKHVVFESNKKGFSGEYDKFRLYYKFNSKAELIDSLTTDNYDDYEIFKSYLMSRDDYISWIIDSDTTRNKYVELNADLKWTPDHIKREYDKLSKEASSHYFFRGVANVRDSGNPALNIDKNIFLIDKKWYALYGDDLFEKPTTEKQIETEPKKIILPIYTQRLQDHKYFSYLSAYYDLIIKKDTLKIKAEMWSDRLEIHYYSHPEYPDFCILGSFGYFFIKPKK
jgi:hypothetical protein